MSIRPNKIVIVNRIYLKNALRFKETLIQKFLVKLNEIAKQSLQIKKRFQFIFFRLEVTLFEQIEEVNQTFEQTLAEMINNFIGKPRQFRI